MSEPKATPIVFYSALSLYPEQVDGRDADEVVDGLTRSARVMVLSLVRRLIAYRRFVSEGMEPVAAMEAATAADRAWLAEVEKPSAKGGSA